MGTASSSVVTGPHSPATTGFITTPDSNKIIPIAINKYNYIRANHVAPIIIRNCKEEFQHIIEFKEPLVRGSISKTVPPHWLISNKNVLVRDVLPRPDKSSTLDLVKTPNLWRADGPFPVYGTGQPTRVGLEEFVSRIQTKNNRVYLFNLREEPVLYVRKNHDMISYSPRDIESLHSCDVKEGRTIKETIENEADVRKQVVALATFKEEYEFHFYDNVDDFVDEPHKYPVLCEDDVVTSEEIFRRMQFLNKNVIYQRLAFPPNRAPNEENFDRIVESILENDSFFEEESSRLPSLVFVDQSGDQQTTTAMVIGCLLLARKKDQLIGEDHEGGVEYYDLAKGDFIAICELVQKLPNGRRIKHEVDVVIDMCSKRNNIRSDIFETKSLLDEMQSDYKLEGESARKYFSMKFMDHLERYFFLICFNAYLHEQYSKKFRTSFSKWMQNHLHLLRILRHLDTLERNTHPELLSQGMRSLVADDYIGLDVLSTKSELKVSNFRKMAGLPVFGVAQPSRQGLLTVLQELTSEKYGHPIVLLVDLRDDVQVVCDDEMFSVRENSNLEAPITIPGLNSTEIKEREDKLKQMLIIGAAVQVYDDINGEGTLKAFQHPKTFKDVVELVQRDTKKLVYGRLPMTDDFAPDEKDFDYLISTINGFEEMHTDEDGPALVFSCRTGGGRTTTAMAIAGLVCCHKKGFPYGSKPGEQDRVSVPNAAYTKGDFIVVRKLIGLIPNGQQIKREVDFILDMCSETMTPMHYHIREVIFVTYNQMRGAKSPDKRETLRRKSIAFLERYIYLILLNAYLHMERRGNWEKPFSLWLREVGPRSGIFEVLNDIAFYDFESDPCRLRKARYRWLNHRADDSPWRGSFT